MIEHDCIQSKTISHSWIEQMSNFPQNSDFYPIATSNYKFVSMAGDRRFRVYTSMQVGIQNLLPTWPSILFNGNTTATAEMMGLYYNLQTSILLVCGGQQVNVKD